MFQEKDIIRSKENIDEVYRVLERVYDCYIIEDMDKELFTVHERPIHQNFKLDKVYLRKKKIQKICSKLTTE